MRRSFSIVAALLASFAYGEPSLHAQFSQSISDDSVDSFVAAQPAPPAPGGTLPPLEIRPTPPRTPDVESDSVPPFDPNLVFNPSANFPSLADQFMSDSASDFSGLNGASRGPKTLFDQSNFGSIVNQTTLREKMATDMFRALQNEPGVLMQATGRGQASPFIRGVTGQQVLILVDGVRVNNQAFRSGPNQYFNTIDPGQVDRVEVIRGAGSVLWGGDAIGGVINIVTRGADSSIGDYRGGSFRTSFSTADNAWYGRANVEGWVGSSGIFAGGSYMDVHDLDRGGSLGRQPFTGYDQYAGDVKYNFMINDSQMLTVMVSHFEQQNLPRSDRFAPFVSQALNPNTMLPLNTARPTFFDPQQRDMGYVRWQGFAEQENMLFDTFSLTGSYSRTKEGSREIRSATRTDIGEFSDDVVGFTFSLQKDWDALGIFTYGADYYHDDLDSSRVRFNPVANTSTISAPQFPNDAFADRAGSFMHWDVKLTDRLSANAGMRYEVVDLHATPQYTIGGVPQNIHFVRNYDEWIGSVGANYLLDDNWSVVAGMYEGFRSPTMDDLTANVTFLQNAQQNPVLASLGVKPEHSYTYEIGTKYNTDNLRLQLYQWWMTIDNYITRSVDGVGNVFLGNHEAYLNGTELAAEYLLNDQWSLYGNYAYTFGQDLTDHVPYTRIPPLQGVVGLRWRDEPTRSYFDIFTWMVDRQDRYNPTNLSDSRFWVNGQPATPGYATLNLRCGTALGETQSHRVSLMLENLTNQYHRVLGSGVDGTGINAIFGYEFVH